MLFCYTTGMVFEGEKKINERPDDAMSEWIKRYYSVTIEWPEFRSSLLCS